MPSELALRAWSRLCAFGHWLGTISFRNFALLVLGVELLRLGVHWIRTPAFGYEEWAANWPAGSSWDSSPAWLIPVLMGAGEPPLWPAFWIVVGITAVALVPVLAHATLKSPASRIFILGVMASGIPLRLIEGSGHYDILFLLGTVLLVFRNPVIWIPGAILAAASHAEMAIVAGVAVLLVGAAFTQRSIRIRGISLTVSGLLLAIAVQVIGVLATGSSTGRGSVFGEHFTFSISTNLPWLPMTIAAGYLGAWIPVMTMLMSMGSRRTAMLLATALVVIPLIVMFFTLDGTRVFVIASAAAFMLAWNSWLRSNFSDGILHRNHRPVIDASLALLFLIVIVVPEVSVFTLSPDVRLAPWQTILDVYFAVVP